MVDWIPRCHEVMFTSGQGHYHVKILHLDMAHEGSSASACLPSQADSAWPSHLTSIPVLGQTYPVALISCPTCLLRAVQFSGASGQSSGFQPGDVWPCLDILNCHNSGEGAVGI